MLAWHFTAADVPLLWESKHLIGGAVPIYEYRCENCGEELEKFQRIKEETLVDCPKCGQSKLARLISRTSFILKGKGWYATDYGRKG